jgi:hypothetical protein
MHDDGVAQIPSMTVFISEKTVIDFFVDDGLQLTPSSTLSSVVWTRCSHQQLDSSRTIRPLDWHPDMYGSAHGPARGVRVDGTHVADWTSPFREVIREG